MTGYVDASTGRGVLEGIRADEMRTLYIALERECAYHEARAAQLEQEADDRRAQARDQRRGRHANNRAAGELESEAAGHRVLARDAADQARILRPLTTSKDIR